MVNQWERVIGHFSNYLGNFRQGGSTFPSYIRIILGLGLLNLVLLIAAIVIGIKCARVKDGSLHISHSTVTQLISELDYLRSNHSDVIEAEEEAKKSLERALKHHQQLKEQTEQQKIISDGFMRQIETLRTEKTNLQSNISALEGTCGRCLPGWSLYNTSCYFFSSVGSSTLKKNWPDSKTDCISRGARLVVIDNWEEQLNIFENLPNTNLNDGPWWGRTGSIWIGLTDGETEGTWVWVNNVTLGDGGYWIQGEPNNHGDNENCGAFLKIDDPRKSWFDSNCQDKKEWLCEMQPN
ncbi:hypothetical protein Q8A73_017393 [Channa argus]|nr:hypothetical protein Q8A73_017393 [Channa argus]